jgi:hypothetical protein
MDVKELILQFYRPACSAFLSNHRGIDWGVKQRPRAAQRRHCSSPLRATAGLELRQLKLSTSSPQGAKVVAFGATMLTAVSCCAIWRLLELAQAPLLTYVDAR